LKTCVGVVWMAMVKGAFGCCNAFEFSTIYPF